MRYKEEIELNVRALMGKSEIKKRHGRAWGKYDSNISNYLLGIVIGREITWEEAKSTNEKNPQHTGYAGKYVSAKSGSNAVERWVAEMCDHTAAKLKENGFVCPVGFVSWPTLDPMIHHTENTPGVLKEMQHEDSQVLNPERIVPSHGYPAGLFGCYHIYPHFPDFMYRKPEYSYYRDKKGILRYGGYLREFMKNHPEYPALIGEFGISTSLGCAHKHPEGFHHGRVEEKTQGLQLARMYRAILKEGYAGGMIFEWHDEWAKKSWVEMCYMIPYARHIYWHNTFDPEQAYGIVAHEPARKPFRGSEKAYFKQDALESKVFSIEGLDLDYNEAFLFLRLKLSGKSCRYFKPGGTENVSLLIAIDTFGDLNGTRRLPHPQIPLLPTGVEFLLKVSARKGAVLLARPDYNRGDSKFSANPSNDPDFKEVKVLVNREQVSDRDGTLFPAVYFNQSILSYGDFRFESKKYNSLAHYFVDDQTGSIVFRLPWALLNVSDPSSRRVLYDSRENLPAGPAELWLYSGIDSIGTRKTKGFKFYIAAIRNEKIVDLGPRGKGGFKPDTERFFWKSWDEPVFEERLKKSYPIIRKLFSEVRSFPE